MTTATQMIVAEQQRARLIRRQVRSLFAGAFVAAPRTPRGRATEQQMVALEQERAATVRVRVSGLLGLAA